MQVKYKSLRFTGYYLFIKIFIKKFFIEYFITSSQIIVESSVILAKYFQFSQLHVAGLQK